MAVTSILLVSCEQTSAYSSGVPNELSTDYERAAEHRDRKLKTLWESQEAERLRRQHEVEQARWA
jgi:hypothetical protein